ncbi:helicase HerA-like domain-containing protein [Streptomyces sp. DG1A-41]|uniref:helicase HerA-like domain-containing protein n=1 Tax=Streptomyces sp. DG1A-41 TaxID=3125779 RepID=UPI0030D5612B
MGRPGVPVRATVTSFGPVLLSKVLRLNRTQEQCLALIFHYADGRGLQAADVLALPDVAAHRPLPRSARGR